MKKRMLADVLWEAANEHLALDGSLWIGSKSVWSCWAVSDALGRRDGSLDRVTNSFLRSLGCKTNSDTQLGYDFTEHMQGIRYMWLLLAMHVAEDEGIEL